jgi:plastocyanin
MKKIILSMILTVFCFNSYSTTFNVTSVGFTFSPATITITQNDNVTFTLGAFHDAVEVSLDTWNANGISPIIGFSVPFGGGTLSGSSLSVGTHYYVCENHAFFGMKGTIIVESPAAGPETKIEDNLLIYPNPAKDNITIQLNPTGLKMVGIKLFNLEGKLVNVLLPKTEVSGLFVRSFPLNNVARQGIYFIQIAENEKTAYQKIVIL